MAIMGDVTGDRIRLSALDPERLSPEYALWMKDPDVLQFLAEPAGDYSPGALREYVRRMNASPADHFSGIFLNATGEHIGNIKIGSVHPYHRRADIGLLVGAKKMWGQGFGTEALFLATRYALAELGLNKLYAGILVTNTASRRAFSKVGYREVGIYERHWRLGDEYVDAVLVECCAPFRAELSKRPKETGGRP